MSIFRTFKKPSAEIYFTEAEQYCSSNYIPPAVPESESIVVKYSICIPEPDYVEEVVEDSDEQIDYKEHSSTKCAREYLQEDRGRNLWKCN